MENTIKEKKIDNRVQPVSKGDQFMLPSWVIILILVGFFIFLKKVIYLKDTKRHE